jgi:hypothetical protein
MQYLRIAAALAALATCSLAQDKVTLANGDVLTGKITMAAGKITVVSKLLGDVTVPIGTVSTIVTEAPAELESKDGTRTKAASSASTAATCASKVRRQSRSTT